MKARVILAFMTTVGCLVLASQPAAAKKKTNMLDQALNQTLEERQKIENSYRSNFDAALSGETQESRQKGRNAIAVEVGDELPSGSSRDWAPSGEDRTYRELNVVEKLEREFNEVDRSFREKGDARPARERQLREARERARGRGRNL